MGHYSVFPKEKKRKEWNRKKARNWHNLSLVTLECFEDG
jgi:hypothetical protein